jgi:hypothetical protein
MGRTGNTSMSATSHYYLDSNGRKYPIVDGSLRRRETGAPGFVCAVRAEDGVEVEIYAGQVRKERMKDEG